MSEYKLMPVEPTIEMIAELGFNGDYDLAAGHAALCADLEARYRAMLAAAPEAEPVAGPRKKDSVLFHLAEILRKAQGRTCDETGDEIDVGYECMRIRDLCKASPPAPDVSALVEALELFVSNPTPTSEDFDMARNALAAHRQQGGEQ